MLARGAPHIPYSKASFEQLKELFPDVEILLPDSHPNSQENKRQVPVEPQAVKPASTKEATNSPDASQPQQQDQVKLVITAKKLFVQVKKQETDIKFLRSLHYARWNANTYLWEITNSETNLQLLRNYFVLRLTDKQYLHQKVSLPAKNSRTNPKNSP